ncbi:MAG: ComF family protein [Acidobacteria bacterium]|nr:ComF family protein [Acidobacteriota bacterium]
MHINDATWRSVRAGVDPAARLRNNTLSPLITEVWACGAYYSRGTFSGRPWSRMLRSAKHPPEADDERAAVISVVTGFFCRFILEHTSLLSQIDAVVSIPANPARYNARRMSLPDELARAVERQLTVPFVFTALTYKAGAELDLRGLSRAERYRAVRGSMGAGDLGLAAGRKVLVVDDVITSGATLSEAARLLRDAGVSDVYGMTICHTEG